jgi:hypothetical protein
LSRRTQLLVVSQSVCWLVYIANQFCMNDISEDFKIYSFHFGTFRFIFLPLSSIYSYITLSLKLYTIINFYLIVFLNVSWFSSSVVKLQNLMSVFSFCLTVIIQGAWTCWHYLCLVLTEASKPGALSLPPRFNRK